MNARDQSFEWELAQLINKHSWEQASNTPDFILARMMVAAFHAFSAGIEGREMWHGREAPIFATEVDAVQARREGRGMGHEESPLSTLGTGPNIIVLDLETAHSADDLDTGWNDKAALGLSIGCFWSYRNNVMHWFDMQNLMDTIRVLVADQPLMVSFNGISFDFPLICGLIHNYADDMSRCPHDGIELFVRSQEALHSLGSAFQELASRSYDILAEIWKIDPGNKFAPGLNSLNVICQQTGLGPKLSSGAQAPKDWQAGRYAQVLNYCQDDVLKTKSLFEIIGRDKPIFRGDAQPIHLPYPALYRDVDKERMIPSTLSPEAAPARREGA